jgi:hypothetical protein
MAATTEALPAIPDYMLDPNAVTKDDAVWRGGKAPDYSNTRRVWEQSKNNLQISDSRSSFEKAADHVRSL